MGTSNGRNLTRIAIIEDTHSRNVKSLILSLCVLTEHINIGEHLTILECLRLNQLHACRNGYRFEFFALKCTRPDGSQGVRQSYGLYRSTLERVLLNMFNALRQGKTLQGRATCESLHANSFPTTAKLHRHQLLAIEKGMLVKAAVATHHYLTQLNGFQGRSERLCLDRYASMGVIGNNYVLYFTVIARETHIRNGR